MKRTISIVAVLVVCVLVSMLVLTACNREHKLNMDENLQANLIDDNYRTFYEIFVGGFSDSNGDGVGDIRGLINRLDYLNDGDPNSGKSLGITGIWLMPIMQSPSYHKYDVTDYKSVDTKYGTLDDVKELVQECHKRGIKLIIDLVLNHTAAWNEWFLLAQQAIKKGDVDSKYYDYYTKSTKKETAYWYEFAKDPSGQQWYYEGNFSSGMPELNYDNENVKKEVEEIVKFWLNDVGVDGFRLDAVRYIYLNDTTRNVDFLTWFREFCQSIKPDVYIVGEDWNNTTEELNYYKAIDVFNFGMGNNVINALQGQLISSFAESLVDYYNAAKAARSDAILQPFLSNHDQDRIAGNGYFIGKGEKGKTTFLSANAKMAANLYILSPGNPFIYYGEEIGMMGSRGTASTDANRRLAMLWGDKDTVQDPADASYRKEKQTNGTVKSQISDANSLYNHYKLLIAIRNANPEIARGDIEIVSGFGSSSTVCVLKFTYKGSVVYVVHNISNYDAEINLSSLNISGLRALAGEGGGSLNGATLTLGGKTSAVLK